MTTSYQTDLPPTLQPATYNNQTEWVPVEPGDLLGSDATTLNDYGTAIPGDAMGFDFLSSTFLLGNVGAPFVIGLAVGYFAKKMLRIALFLAGGAIVLLFVTEYYGVTTLADSQLQNAAEAATNLAKDSGQFLIDRLSRISTKGVSAVAGFFVGLKFG